MGTSYVMHMLVGGKTVCGKAVANNVQHHLLATTNREEFDKDPSACLKCSCAKNAGKKTVVTYDRTIAVTKESDGLGGFQWEVFATAGNYVFTTVCQTKEAATSYKQDLERMHPSKWGDL